MSFLSRITGSLRHHKKKSIALTIGAVLLLFAIWGITRPKAPEYVTAVAERGDLRQIVEAVGTIVSERELELRFAATGIVQQVFVREGDRVTAGQKLAQLKAGSLAASIGSQAAALASAQADLRALEEGNRPEDIAIAEADLQNKRAALQSAKQTLASAELNIGQSEAQLTTLKQEASVNLAGQVSTSLSGLSGDLTSIENSLAVIDDILARTDVNDALVKGTPASKGLLQGQKRAAVTSIASARASAVSAAGDYQAALKVLVTAKNVADESIRTMDSLFSLISGLPETQYFSASARETVKNMIGSERSSMQTASSSLSSALSALQNASATYDTRISSQESSVVTSKGTRDKAKIDIMTYESNVRSAEAQLQLKRAGARQTDIDSARARVRQAQANLAGSQAQFNDTILTAPVNGTVTHVNIRIGESLPTGAAVTLLGESPYRTEMFVSEIDIPKVKLTQSGSIELDAFRGTHFTLRVGDIDPAATDKDGVPKYRVRLDFLHRYGELKIGMTGDAEIVTGERADVVSIPQRAVIEDDDGNDIVRILQDDQTVEERPVETGMEGASGDIEVTGVKEGEVVIVLIKK